MKIIIWKEYSKNKTNQQLETSKKWKQQKIKRTIRDKKKWKKPSKKQNS